MHALRYHACCFTVSAPSCTLYVDLCIVPSNGRSAELLFKNNSTVRHLLENFPHVTGPVVLRLDQQGQESEGQGHELSRSKPITLAVCQHAGCGWNWEELAGNVPDIRICCIDWTTFVILIKFANYMDWFLICKCCKFCEEIWYISIDRIFPTGYVFGFWSALYILKSRVVGSSCDADSFQQQQESRAAARKPRDAASLLFGWSSPTTFLISIRLAMLRKPRFRAPNMLAQNTI